jgi:chromosome partitioning protein
MPIIVSFVSQKGGVGKSTLARALAAVSGHFMRVRLADLDEQQETVLHWERAREQDGRRPPCEVAGYNNVGEAIAQSGDVELLVIDAPARTNRQILELAAYSHLVVQPTGASADDLRPAVLLFHELVKAGIPKARLAAAICRTMSDTEEAAARAYMQAAGYSVLEGSIPEKPKYREAQNRGASITETTIAKLNQRADVLMEALRSGGVFPNDRATASGWRASPKSPIGRLSNAQPRFARSVPVGSLKPNAARMTSPTGK